MSNGGDVPTPPPEEPANVDSPAPADEPAPADASTVTAADAQLPEAVTTLQQSHPEDTLGILLLALYQSYLDTGWSDQTYHLLILTTNEYASLFSMLSC
jgi:hypothetical protein